MSAAGSAGVVFLYLLVWCLTISRVYWYSVSLSAVPACEVNHYRSCLLFACLYSATLSDMHAGFIYSDTRVCKVSPSGENSGMLQIHQTCLQVRCGSHVFVKLINYHPGRHLEYIEF